MVQVRYDSLRTQQHPIIRDLATTLEMTWQNTLELSEFKPPQDLGYVEGTLEGERLIIENSCYQTPQFRKLHIELAKVGNNLDILHCVMFPRPAFHLPIFGLDIIANRVQISAAIVDLSPVTPDRRLPAAYTSALDALPPMQFSQHRALPDWGNIFSDHCLFVRPNTLLEGQAFLTQASRYLNIHCQQAKSAQPSQSLFQQVFKRAVRRT